MKTSDMRVVIQKKEENFYFVNLLLTFMFATTLCFNNVFQHKNAGSAACL